MERGNLSWKEKKNMLVELVTKLDRHYGGNDEIFLNQYIAHLVKDYYYKLDEALDCFWDLWNNKVETPGLTPVKYGEV